MPMARRQRWECNFGSSLWIYSFLSPTWERPHGKVGFRRPCIARGMAFPARDGVRQTVVSTAFSVGYKL
jgi:hypothetical protein